MVRQAYASILSLAGAMALLIGPTPPAVTAAEFMQQGPFWQADLAGAELEGYTADSLASAGLPETVAQAAVTAGDDLQRVLAQSADGVTLLGSSQGGALVVVPQGWLSAGRPGWFVRSALCPHLPGDAGRRCSTDRHALRGSLARSGRALRRPAPLRPILCPGPVGLLCRLRRPPALL